MNAIKFFRQLAQLTLAHLKLSRRRFAFSFAAADAAVCIDMAVARVRGRLASARAQTSRY